MAETDDWDGFDDSAPGWDAIDDALRTAGITGDPLHWGTGNLPGQAGLQGISAYRRGSHWLLISYGLTELFLKESDDPDVSGWGFELTMRVPVTEETPPPWSITLLNKLGSYVFDHGSPFADGHRMFPGGPITGSPDSRLTALAFVADPELNPADTVNGKVQFLSVVGITDEELRAMKASSTATVIRDLIEVSPLLLTIPDR